MFSFFALLLSAAIAVGVAITQPEPISPIMLVICIFNGTLCARYFLNWACGRYNLFDPIGLFGFFGIIYFLISPLVQIGNDFWPFIPPLTADHDWLILWALLNSIGLIAFTFIVDVQQRRPIVDRQFWTVDASRFTLAALVAMAVSVIIQLYILARFGGVAGLVSTYSMRQEMQLGRTEDDPFNNLGLPLLIAESFKYVFAMYVIIRLKNVKVAKSVMFFVFLMSMFFIVFMVFGGLRGSRSSTVFSLIFAAGMYHFWIKELSRKTVLIGIVFLFGFLNAYYWYKISGQEGLSAIFSAEERSYYSEDRQDNLVYVVARDMGRMDVQTLAMMRSEDGRLPYAWGKTYLDAPFTIIPKVLVPWKPETLVESKNVIANRVSLFSRDSTIVMGMVGEGVINFGPIGGLASFAVLGCLMAWARRLLYSLRSGDIRRLLFPVIALTPVLFLIEDAGLIVMIVAKALLVPIIILFISSKKMDYSKMKSNLTTRVK